MTVMQRDAAVLAHRVITSYNWSAYKRPQANFGWCLLSPDQSPSMPAHQADVQVLAHSQLECHISNILTVAAKQCGLWVI
jgi:hypothetical protein